MNRADALAVFTLVAGSSNWHVPRPEYAAVVDAGFILFGMGLLAASAYYEW